MTDARMSSILLHRNIRGIILPPHPQNQAVITLDWSRFAVVTHAFSIKEPPIHRIARHHMHAAQLAVKKCRELGYRRIGFAVDRAMHERTEHLWLGGYLSEIDSQAASERIPPYIGLIDDAFVAWFKRHRPDYLILTQTQCVTRLQAEGLTAPQDYAFVHLNLTRTRNDEKEAKPATPAEFMLEPPASPFPGSIAGVVQRHHEMGSRAASQIAAHLQHNEVGLPEIPEITLFKGYWTDGSSAPPHR